MVDRLLFAFCIFTIMHRKRFLCFVLIFFVICGSVPATYAKKRTKTNIKLLEAYSQRTIPGIPGAKVQTAYNFIVIWQGAKYPETFFWRGDGGWLTCSISKAHKATKVSSPQQRMDYSIERVTNDNIHKGDTLDLIPTPGGKFPIPAEIPTDAKNTLFYKTGGSGWLSFPVNTIGKKPDRVMQ